MKQLELPEEMKVPVNFEGDNIPSSAKLLKPLVYQEGDSICVVLGPDPTEGVYGCGPTKEEALEDWDIHLKERLVSADEKDEVARYIKAQMNLR